MQRIILKLILAILLFVPVLAVAEPQNYGELTIVDSSDVPRATAQVDASAHLLFVLNDASGRLADGVNVTLTEKATGDTISIQSDEGRAVFCDVPSGVWQVTSNVDWAVFNSIDIENSADPQMLRADCTALGTYVAAGGGSGILGAVIGVTAVGGATTAAVVGYNNRQADKKENRPLSPSR